VKVEGEWYPIKLLEKLTGFTPEQFKQAKNNLLFQEFLGLTHVCANASVVIDPSDLNNPKEYRKQLINKSNLYIYCVMDGGDKI